MEKDVRCCSLWLLVHGNQSWELQHPLCVLNVNAGTAQGMRTPEAGFLRPEFRPLLAENNSQRFLATHSTDLSMSTQSPALWFHCASSLLCCLKDGEPSNWMSLGSQKGSCPSFEGHISRRGSLAQSISLFLGFTMAAPSLQWSASFPPLGNPRHREAGGTVCRHEQSILVKANAAQHKEFSVISAQA